MRKIAVFAIAAMMLAIAAIAYAQDPRTNTYEVTASTTPKTKGTTSKPVAVGVTFNYKVGEQQNRRPQVIQKYSIRFGGLRTNTNSFPACTAAKINAAGNDSGCAKGSAVGTGDVTNNVGATGNVADKSIVCFLKLTVYNSGNQKGALYLKGGPNQTPSCPTEISVAIDARFVRRGAATALEFQVPQSLKHPIANLDNAVVDVKSKIKKLTRKVNGKTKGFFEAVGGCNKAGSRDVTVVFTPESGPSATAQTKAKCS
jgi:hypothetical protein